MNDREGKEKGGGRPEGGHRKTRRPKANPTSVALESLIFLLIPFARDLRDEYVRVEDAALHLEENLADWLKRYGSHG